MIFSSRIAVVQRFMFRKHLYGMAIKTEGDPYQEVQTTVSALLH